MYEDYVDESMSSVGFDGRNSSPSLSKKLIEGILSTGCNVNNIGLVPTPILYYLVTKNSNDTNVFINLVSLYLIGYLANLIQQSHSKQ